VGCSGLPGARPCLATTYTEIVIRTHMSGRRFIVSSWLGVLFVTHLVSAQQNYGMIQGRLAEGFKEVQMTERMGLQKVSNGAINLTIPVSVNGSKPLGGSSILERPYV
jgi:hypothetical protein